MNHLDRRDFLGLALAAGAAIALPAWARAARRSADTYFDVVPIGDKGNAFAIQGEGGNSLLIMDGDSALLVDCKNGPFGQVLLDDIRKLGAGDNLTVLNTHHHGDHTAGNFAFKGSAEIMAHGNALPRIDASMDWYRSMGEQAVRQLDQLPADKRALAEDAVMAYAQKLGEMTADMFRPDTPVSEPKKVIACGGIDVELHSMGSGHTDNDLVVYCRELNLIHTGDLVFNNVHPFMDANGGCEPRNWQGVLRGIQRLGNDDTRIVPGHGAIGDKAVLNGQIAYIDNIIASVGESIEAGMTREQVTETTYEFQQGVNVDWIRPIANGFVYDMLQK
ncbi:MAG: MBL fold metallo-hydrolase [Planctomycetota bacterium]